MGSTPAARDQLICKSALRVPRQISCPSSTCPLPLPLPPKGDTFLLTSVLGFSFHGLKTRKFEVLVSSDRLANSVLVSVKTMSLFRKLIIRGVSWVHILIWNRTDIKETQHKKSKILDTNVFIHFYLWILITITK